MVGLFTDLLLVLACLASTSAGVRQVDVKQLLQQAWLKRRGISDTVTSFRYKRDAGRMAMRDLNDIIAMGEDTKLQIVQTTMTVQGTKLIKMQEMFKDRTVADAIVTVETDAAGENVIDASGELYSDIDLDLDPSYDLVNSQQALESCIRHHNDEMFRDHISHVKTEPQVLMDETQQPYPTYLAQYLVLGEGQERRPTCIVDARDDRVTLSWDALDSCSDCTAKGDGGNLNIGKIHYGLLQHCLDLRRENGVCYLQNKYVRVIHNNFTEGEKDGDEVASYDCHNMGDEVNGAYSPLLDALFYGTVVGRMYEDWYDTAPLELPITLRVHYGVNVSNAYWNGYECQYGDGDEILFPLISLDVVSHEIAHGVTEMNSNLYYFEQWGGINEAFSDMAGETAEAYLSEADWMIGIDISKTGKPLRYLAKPEQDNVSISHVDDFTDKMDPHFGSGVYNHVFYLLVHNYSLPIRDVFHVFLHANKMYWHHMSSYAQAACDVMKAAYDLGQDGGKFRQAFMEVGLDTCDIGDHVMGLRAGKLYSNITVSKHISPFFIFGVPGEFADNVTVKASSLHGEVYIVASNRTWAAVEGEEDVYVYAEGLSLVQFQIPSNTAMHFSLTLFTDSPTPLTDVDLVASYECMQNYTPTNEDESSYYVFFIWKEICEKANENGGGDGNIDQAEEEKGSEENKNEKDKDRWEEDASSKDNEDAVNNSKNDHSESNFDSAEGEQGNEVEEEEDLFKRMFIF